jgi:hypothetical protein
VSHRASEARSQAHDSAHTNASSLPGVAPRAVKMPMRGDRRSIICGPSIRHAEPTRVAIRVLECAWSRRAKQSSVPGISELGRLTCPPERMSLQAALPRSRDTWQMTRIVRRGAQRPDLLARQAQLAQAHRLVSHVLPG